MSVGTCDWQSDFAREYVGTGREEGRGQGLAQSVVPFLDARGFEVSDEVRRRVESCDDLDTLQTWVHRAAKVDGPEELLG
ncbi:hypothetical protein A6A08_20480 [Nocardiopsis sp. TSRI0078]|uniref:hypothetical protein n=1 Tax=unclassified Nocardiopsis TaxID=2649073 RepID=UPI00093B86FF|nr:hypothetical protein [Nocardiopsis sp. TSRI0078]OKI21962.1 hypothetical protein A6A08_20480 [Nocardiopsis sp. TSRI0078]